MPKKKKGGPNQLVPQENVKKLWKLIPAREWQHLLVELDPSNSWTLKGSMIQGNCPYHEEKTPSFFVNTIKGLYKCFGACEKIGTDPISLIAKIRNESYTNTILFLRNKFQLETIFSGPETDRLNEYHENQELKKYVALACGHLIGDYVRGLESNLNNINWPFHYLKYIHAYAFIGRDLKFLADNVLPIGYFGKPEHLKTHIPRDYHAAFEDYFKKELESGRHYGSAIFHFNDSPGTISRFKYNRRDEAVIAEYDKTHPNWTDPRDVPKEMARRFFQSQSIWVHDAYSQNIGLFGMYKYHKQIGKSDANAYITEGEFDALSIMSAQDNLGRPDFMIFSTGGRTSLDVSFLHDYGVRTIWLIPDAPSKMGDEYTTSFLSVENNFRLPIGSASRPMQLKIFNWPHGFLGEDLADAVTRNSYETVAQHIWVDRQKYFTNSTPWVESKATQKIRNLQLVAKQEKERIDREEENYEVQVANIEDELRTHTKNTLLQWLRYITDQEEKSRIVNQWSVDYNIQLDKIPEVNSSIHSLETLAGVDQKLTEVFNDLYAPSYYERKNTGICMLTLWSKIKQEPVTVSNDQNSIASFISSTTKTEFYDWLEHTLGGSSVLMSADKEVDPITEYQTKCKNGTLLINRVFNRMLTKINSKGDMMELSQGIFYTDVPSIGQKDTVYFVNGKLLFRGVYSPEGDGIEWESVNNSCDKDILFRLNNNRAWSFVKDVSDLYEAAGVDLDQLYSNVLRIVNGWKFKDHEIMSRYIAAWILSIPIQRAIGDVNVTYLTGESESGKTSFCRGLLGGKDASGYATQSILEATKSSSDFTEAFFYQYFDQTAVLAVKDEAESTAEHQAGGSHEARTKALYAHINSIPFGGASVSRGAADPNNLISYFLRMPVLLAGINLPADPTFLSRTVVISTVKEVGRKHPDLHIAEEFPEEDALEQVKRSITIGFLPHLPELVRLRNGLRKKLAELNKKISNRFTQNLLSPIAVYAFIKGEDAAIDLYKQLIHVNKDRLESIHSVDSTNELLTAVLYNKNIKANIDTNLTDYVNVKHLALTEQFNLLNNSDCGVYFLEEKSWFVVVWRMAKFGILERTKFQNMDEMYLRDRASKCSYVVPEVSEAEHRFIQRKLGLRDVKSSLSYTAFHVGYLMDIQDEVEMLDEDGQPPVDVEIQKEVKEVKNEVVPTEDDPFADIYIDN